MIAPDAVQPEALPYVLALAAALTVLVIVKGWWRA